MLCCILYVVSYSCLHIVLRLFYRRRANVWDCLVYDDKDTAIADVKSYITYLEGEGYEIVKDSTNVYASDVAELDSGAKDLDFKLQNGKNEIDISYSEQVQWKGNEGKTGVSDLIYYNE